MGKTLKIGDKAKGFKYKSEKYKANECFNLTYYISMDNYIGEIGKIFDIQENYFAIEFEDAEVMFYPLDLMHLAVVEENPQIIEIDMSKVDKIEAFYCDFGKELNKSELVYIANTQRKPAKYLRITLKDENKLKIKQEIKELEEKIKELKKKL